MPAFQTWGHPPFLKTKYARFFRNTLLVVVAAHGALVLLSLRTVVPPQAELPAMAAFFVTPVAPPSAPAVQPRPAQPQPRPLSTPSMPDARPIERASDLPSTVVPAQADPADATPRPATPAAAVTEQPVSVVPTPTEPTTTAPLSVAIEAVRYRRPPQVVYPPLSRRMGETGRVVVRVLVDTQGVPVEAIVAEPSRYTRLNDQAVQALLLARFEPYRVNGRAMSVTVLAPIVFTLEDRP